MMTQTERAKISPRHLLALAGLSAGAKLLARPPLSSELNLVPTMMNAAAKAKIGAQPIRRNISVLEGSGGNIAISIGNDGMAWLYAAWPPIPIATSGFNFTDADVVHVGNIFAALVHQGV